MRLKMCTHLLPFLLLSPKGELLCTVKYDFNPIDQDQEDSFAEDVNDTEYLNIV